ncbi:MAG TPA: hypothetical protein VN618_03555 [Solirubrobacteraceae bacterium]|nr:hypothetical protein [Solirubrobacteraceae bacterium]
MRDTILSAAGGRARRAIALAGALLAVAAWLAVAPRALSATVANGSVAEKKAPASATLEQCVTSAEPAERSATFAGEMSVVPGSSKMEMRIDVLERQPREMAFHAVSAAGLGVWRTAAPGVKTYRYLKQVTNLAAPAYYRAAIRFRWLSSKGKLIKTMELHTARCLQTVQTAEEPVGGEAPARSA